MMMTWRTWVDMGSLRGLSRGRRTACLVRWAQRYRPVRDSRRRRSADDHGRRVQQPSATGTDLRRDDRVVSGRSAGRSEYEYGALTVVCRRQPAAVVREG